MTEPQTTTDDCWMFSWCLTRKKYEGECPDDCRSYIPLWEVERNRAETVRIRKERDAEAQETS